MSESRQWARGLHTNSIMTRIKSIFCGRRFTEPTEPVQSPPAQPAQTEEAPWWLHDLDLDIPPTSRPYEAQSCVVSSPATPDANNYSTPATSMRSTTPPGTPPSLDALLSPIVADADCGIPLIREESYISSPTYPLDASKPEEMLGLALDTRLDHCMSDDRSQTPLVSPQEPSLPSASETYALSETIAEPLPPAIQELDHEQSSSIRGVHGFTTYDLFQQLSAKLHAEMRAMVVLQQHIEAKREIESLRAQVALLKEQKERNLVEMRENVRILAEKKAFLEAKLGDER